MMMLEIRRPQLNALSTVNERKLVDNLVAYLGATFPELIESSDFFWVQDAVEATVVKAKQFEIIAIDGIYSFVTAAFWLGPNFFEEPRIAKNLYRAKGHDGHPILDVLADMGDDVLQSAFDRSDWKQWLPEKD
jgi:hypothetical protein